MGKNKNFFYEFGNECFGPLLLNFSCWLKEELKNRNIKKVYFLARDGYIMKKAFDIMNDDKEFQTYYFYASRRSIIVPSLCKLKNVNEIFESIAFKNRLTLNAFFKKVGLDDYDKTEILKKYSLVAEKEYELKELKLMNAFLEEIWPIIKENSKNELNSFYNYAKENGFCDKVAIVDIGWYGTMQKSLEAICSDIDIYGFYMSLIPEEGYYNSEKYKGFIADKTHGIELYNKIHYFISLFEFLFLAQHGSVKRFIDSEENVELYDYEYKDKKEAIYAKELQKGAIQFVLENKDNEMLDNEKCLNNLFRVMLNPTYKEAKIFGDIEFVDDKNKCIAKPESLFKYLINIKKFIYDFKESDWRIGFLKRLLKIILPYHFINNMIRKIFLKKEK